MRPAKILYTLSILAVCVLTHPISSEAGRESSKKADGTGPGERRIVIAASTILDGKGYVFKDTRIVIEGSKIVAIDPKAGPVDYDLRGLTVMPGWIDAHVHITWIFGKDGKNAGQGGTTPKMHLCGGC